MPDWFWPLVLGIVAGEFIGFFLAAILAAGRRADDYDPIENPPPRAMPRISDGYGNEPEPDPKHIRRNIQ